MGVGQVLVDQSNDQIPIGAFLEQPIAGQQTPLTFLLENPVLLDFSTRRSRQNGTPSPWNRQRTALANSRLEIEPHMFPHP